MGAEQHREIALTLTLTLTLVSTRDGWILAGKRRWVLGLPEKFLSKDGFLSGTISSWKKICLDNNPYRLSG